MRASEFLRETATAGASASGSVATVAMPQSKKGGKIGFFGQYVADDQSDNDGVVVLKRDGSSKKKSKKS